MASDDVSFFPSLLFALLQDVGADVSQPELPAFLCSVPDHLEVGKASNSGSWSELKALWGILPAGNLAPYLTT